MDKTAIKVLISNNSIFSAYQDRTVLKNAYNQVMGWNRNMKIDYTMEKFAQAQGCVKAHDDHSSGSSVGVRHHIIACVGGCEYGPGWSWSKSSPVQTWWDFRTRTGHFDAILKYNRVGCSAEKEGNTYCMYCVLK